MVKIEKKETIFTSLDLNEIEQLLLDINFERNFHFSLRNTEISVTDWFSNNKDDERSRICFFVQEEANEKIKFIESQKSLKKDKYFTLEIDSKPESVFGNAFLINLNLIFEKNTSVLDITIRCSVKFTKKIWIGGSIIEEHVLKKTKERIEKWISLAKNCITQTEKKKPSHPSRIEPQEEEISSQIIESNQSLLINITPKKEDIANNKFEGILIANQIDEKKDISNKKKQSFITQKPFRNKILIIILSFIIFYLIFIIYNINLIK